MSDGKNTIDSGTKTAVAPKAAPAKVNPRKLPPYNVVLLNDDDHTYDYVIEMLRAVFGYPEHKGFALAEKVDQDGRVILLTTTKEHAELKQEQVHAFGPDARIENCVGSMWCIIEPAE